MAQHPLDNGSPRSHELRTQLLCAAAALQTMQRLAPRRTSIESRAAIAAIFGEIQIFLESDIGIMSLENPQVPGNTDDVKWNHYIHEWLRFKNGLLQPPFLASIQRLQQEHRKAFNEFQALLSFSWGTRNVGTAILPRNAWQQAKNQRE